MSFETDNEGNEAIENTVEGVLKQEVTGEEPKPKKARILPVRKDIKVEEISTELPLGDGSVFIPSFSIVEEKEDEQVSETEAEPETQAVETDDAKAEEAARAVKAVSEFKAKNRAMVISLRQSDTPEKRTCSQCLKRVPVAQIGFGHAEVCDSCLSR